MNAARSKPLIALLLTLATVVVVVVVAAAAVEVKLGKHTFQLSDGFAIEQAAAGRVTHLCQFNENKSPGE